MQSFRTVVLLCWLIFLLHWIIASARMKHDRGKQAAWHSNVFAVRIALFFLFAMLTLAMRGSLAKLFPLGEAPPQSTILGAAGVVLCAGGIALAMWARVCLGREWSPEPALKEDHRLVTSGPYAYIRHPIYAGVIVAMLGSALVGGVLWAIVLLGACVQFVVRIRTEEHLMTHEFAERYAAYKRRTVALIPFVL